MTTLDEWLCDAAARLRTAGQVDVADGVAAQATYLRDTIALPVGTDRQGCDALEQIRAAADGAAELILRYLVSVTG